MADEPRRLSGRAAVSFLATLLVVAAAGAAPSPPAVPGAELATAPAPLLLNQREPLPGLLTGGAPQSSDGYRALAAAGYRTLIDLRADAELAPEVAAWIAEAGLAWVRIPIAADADLDLGTARALATALAAPEAPRALACASGNRSGALLAVRAFWLEGWSAEEALALGKAGGLTRLEPSVRQLLGLPPLPPAG